MATSPNNPSSTNTMSTAIATPKPRNLILCFDGTGNKFGENSNVVRLFHALVKDNPDAQLVYYQPGIGTYNKRQFITHTASKIATAVDQAVALHINDHVKEGYQYVMRNYRKGDRIHLFGFSRGAHTARVVAGMLYKIGILPADNDQQLDFAFNIYQTTGYKGYELSKEFKETFAMPADIEFVGVWDTVSSVGIIPRSHPYTSVNYAVKHFRHALALDERRARFRPNVWGEATLEREQDLDVDEPAFRIDTSKPRDEWVYEPPNRDFCDVQEVWFSGCHADVGGGSHSNKFRDSLSYIPLRWMIKECALVTDILFNMDYLRKLDIDLPKLTDEVIKTRGETKAKELGFDPSIQPDKTVSENIFEAPSAVQTASSHHRSHLRQALGRVIHIPEKYNQDLLAALFDQLEMAKPWWVLEFIPMLGTYQLPNGTWIRKRMRNFGQGRYIPFFEGGIKVHESVKERVDKTKGTQEPYIPAAYNWKEAEESGMLKYVS